MSSWQPFLDGFWGVLQSSELGVVLALVLLTGISFAVLVAVVNVAARWWK